MDWIRALKEARQSVAEGEITKPQVRSLVDLVCRLAGAVSANQVGHDGERQVWITAGEPMSSNGAIVQHLGCLLRTQINGADMSPCGRINQRSVGRRN